MNAKPRLPEEWAERLLARAEAQRDALLQGARLLVAAAPPHMTYRNAKEREAYAKLRAAIAKAEGSAS